MPTVLFLMTPSYSHIVPAFFLAGLLAHNYNVHFVVSDENMKNIVEGHGFVARITESYRVGMRMEDDFLARRGRKGKWNKFKCVVNNEILIHRQNELRRILNEIRPFVIFIDIFNSSDLFVVFSINKQAKFIYVNPMLSTYKTSGIPGVYDTDWSNNINPSSTIAFKNKIPFNQMIRQPYDLLMSILLKRQWEILSSAGGFSKVYPTSEGFTKPILFRNIPEIILAPIELEFSPKVCKSFQHYFGLCLNKDRKYYDLDNTFTSEFDRILASRGAERRLIYCTFGSYYQGSIKPIFDFLNRLLDAVEVIDNVDLLISTNNLVIESLRNKRRIKDNVYMFTKVAQLQVLKVANLFLTHGGLGSIKESISNGVPMIVYPLDTNTDQVGNALKIESYGLGVSGSLNYDKSDEIHFKILKVLNDPKYKYNVSLINNKIDKKYTDISVNKLLNGILRTI